MAQILRKNFAKFIFVNPFTLVAAVIWDLSNLSWGWRHINLRNHLQPALACCNNNGRTRIFFMARPKTILLMLPFVSPKHFKLHHQTVTDKLFFEIAGQHWFPTKSGIDQFLYICFLAVNFIFERRSRHFEHFRCLFFSIPLPHSNQPLWHSPFLFRPHTLHFLRSIYNAEFRFTRKPTWRSAAPNIVSGRY